MTDETPEQLTVQKQILQLRDKAQELRIDSEESYLNAGELLKQAKRGQKRVDEVFGAAKKATYTAYKEMNELYNKACEPLKTIERLIKSGIATYQTRIEREAEEKRRVAQAAAEKEAEDEQLARARQLELQGKKEKAAEVIEKPVVVPKVPVATAPRISGVSTKKVWSAECHDLKALCKAVAEGNASIDYVQPNMNILNSIARASKDAAFSDTPGVKAVSRSVVSSRT